MSRENLPKVRRSELKRILQSAEKTEPQNHEAGLESLKRGQKASSEGKVWRCQDLARGGGGVTTKDSGGYRVKLSYGPRRQAMGAADD